MPTEIAETILEKIKTLPPEQQERVLQYVNNLERKFASKDKSTGSLKELWEKLDEMRSLVPDDAWDDVPTDGAANVDHYLYGAPKRTK